MIIVAAVLFVVIIATAFGNLLVGLALFKFRYLRTISNQLIGNLALSDFLLATTILPMSTVQECLGHWVFGQFMCNFWLLSDVLYCTASIWNLCIIAFDRFTATLYPLWYREKRSNKQAAIYVALVWIISTAICLPPLFGWNDLNQNYVYNNETNVYNCNLFQTPSYVLYSAAGSFYIPFFITFFLYVRIFIVLRRRMRNMRRTANKRNQLQSSTAKKEPLLTSLPAPVPTPKQHSIEMTNAKSINEVRTSTKRRFEQREMRATIRMAIIIAFFCGMWLGFFTIYVIRGWCPEKCPIPRELDAFFFWLGYSNSSINPILYTIFNEEFRKAFQKILGCYHKSRRGNPGRR
ncbi:hypothetical protein CAPTEDRAFT_138860 [Capitella teleta]|uniref:G-protein coupled receptors family 1 profile domain-containing protein n=1 Tax=Capitella teleta TaxID=283909 RepID=R7V7U1_CAPTE|nr:hypothetical protein CAPTEDRAFT_138860 [Capitella teleta]|eukprot:ELU14928.1 hypothetical protein CAPTEDRAFT_138860 [Capitella teleta]